MQRTPRCIQARGRFQYKDPENCSLEREENRRNVSSEDIAKDAILIAMFTTLLICFRKVKLATNYECACGASMIKKAPF